jgi:predicted DNA-binding protein YlxM (UPF0122 family)
MGANWDEIDECYAELQAARQDGQTAILQRLTEMQLALGEALDAHVAECVIADRFSWQRIADAIGVSRQAASKRWSRKVFPLSA